MQQINGRGPVLKSDFNKVAKQLKLILGTYIQRYSENIDII